MKIIFLDIDGVLNSSNFLFKTKGIIVDPNDLIDKDNVSILNSITDATNAKIVISSDWRHGFIGNFNKLKSVMKNHGITGDIHGMTHTASDNRGKQILDWINDSYTKVDCYIVLDDNSTDVDKVDRRLVRTNSIYGLTLDDAKIAIAMLGK